ncbi:MAG: hypothetical protein JWN89_717 [Parcubacteria group bacterium]|nr:hypothetical protein [Parcubacteria group bacterium]
MIAVSQLVPDDRGREKHQILASNDPRRFAEVARRLFQEGSAIFMRSETEEGLDLVDEALHYAESGHPEFCDPGLLGQIKDFNGRLGRNEPLDHD